MAHDELREPQDRVVTVVQPGGTPFRDWRTGHQRRHTVGPPVEVTEPGTQRRPDPQDHSVPDDTTDASREAEASRGLAEVFGPDAIDALLADAQPSETPMGSMGYSTR